MCDLDSLDEVQEEIHYYLHLLKQEELTITRMKKKIKQLQDRELYLIVNGSVPESIDGE